MRVRVVDAVSVCHAKEKHHSNPSYALTLFILTSLRSKCFTDEGTEAQSNYMTHPRYAQLGKGGTWI